MPTPDLPTDIPDEPAAWQFDPTGQTLIGRLDNADGIAATMRVSLTGTNSWRIPLDDAAVAGLVDETIIKLSIRGAIRTGHRLAQGVVEHAEGGQKWLVFTDQLDLIDILDDGALAPEYGLKRSSSSDRNFGYMSAPGDWVTDDWVDCAGDPVDGGIRNYPDELKADNPEFISIDPTADVSVLSAYFFRSKPGVFNLATAGYVEGAFCFDNFGVLNLDGEQVLQSDTKDPTAFSRILTFRRYLDAGDHQLASYVQNDFELFVGTTPLAMAGAIYATDEQGNHDPGPPLLKTTAADWLVNDGSTPPGFYRAQVLVKAFDEAVADGCTGPSLLTRTFDWINDSNGNPWSATSEVRGTYNFAVNTSLTAMIQALTEQDIDVWVDAATMTLNAAPRLGTDKRDDVTWTVDDTGTLRKLQTTRTAPTFTVIRAQLADRWLEEVAPGATVRKVTGMSLGSISTEPAARAAMQAQLAIYANEVVAVEAEGISVLGDQIFVDCGLGDTVSITDHLEDGLMAVRLLAVSFDGSEVPYKIWPANLTLVADHLPRHSPVTPEEALRRTLQGFASGSTLGRSAQTRPITPTPPSGAQALFVTVVHGTDGTVSRPTARTVYWKGSATPANALPNDFWYSADA